jgi:hypothetical protein
MAETHIHKNFACDGLYGLVEEAEGSCLAIKRGWMKLVAGCKC